VERKHEGEEEDEVTVPRADFHELRNRRRTARPWHRLSLIFYCPYLSYYHRCHRHRRHRHRHRHRHRCQLHHHHRHRHCRCRHWYCRIDITHDICTRTDNECDKYLINQMRDISYMNATNI